METFLNTVRLVLLGLLLLLSGFIFWSGEHLWMFKCSLVATELGQWLVLPCLALAFFEASRLSVSLGLAAALLFSSTPIRAVLVRKELSSHFLEAFGSPLKDTDPIKQSAPVRQSDLEFDPDEHLSLSFFDPGLTRAEPCLIVVHGGGWDGGSRQDCPELSIWLAQRGIAVASIDYRLAPNFHWPAQRDDLLKARAYLAGLYGPTDLDFAWEYGRSDDILDSLALLRSYTGGSPTEFPRIYESASPRLFASGNSPPTLMIHGMKDRLVWHRQSELLDQKLQQESQGRHLLVSLPWAVHAFDYVPDGPGASISALVIFNFLDLNFKGRKSIAISAAPKVPS
jgi:acetyl esterase/lipase